MKCSNCGSELMEGASFCTECGTKVVLKKKFCMNCGAQLADGAKFCIECGEPVDAPVEARNLGDDATNSSDTVVTEQVTESSDGFQDKLASLKGYFQTKVSEMDLFTKCMLGGVVVSIVILLVAMIAENGLGVFLSLLQLLCFVGGLLIHNGKINKFPSWSQYAALGLAIILIITNICSFIPKRSSSSNSYETTIASEKNEDTRPKSAKLPLSAEECVGRNYKDVGSLFETTGFYNVSYDEIHDLDAGETSRVGEIEKVTVNGRTDYSLTTDYDFGTEIQISYHVFKKCNINLEVKFPGNWIFDKYDVVLEMDGIEKETLAHGVDGEFSYEVDPGTYSFVFVSKESSDVMSDTITLDVTGDYNIGLKISCFGDEISVEELYREDMGSLGDNQAMVQVDAKSLKNKPYQDVQKQFEEYGFTNIKYNPKYDCSSTDEKLGKVIAVAVNGSKEFKRGEVFDKDVRVTIAYHEDETKNPQLIMQAELEKQFPKEMAKRAVTVAMTNERATDVFESDGFTLDTTKFHSYSDTTGFYLDIDSEGEWEAVDKSKTWRVDGMVFIINYSTYMKVSCEVKKEDTNYVVSDVDYVIAAKEYLNSDDPSKINPEHLEPSDSNPFLTVPETLIQDDRGTSNNNSYNSSGVTTATESTNSSTSSNEYWIENQFSTWDGSHKELTKLIKKSLNDSKSFKFEDASYIYISDDSSKELVNNTLSELGYWQRVEIGDLFLIETFSAKNSYNARVKCVAYGIVKSDDTCTLVGIQ